jgi:peptide/nickel transport system substrate-binding protein
VQRALVMISGGEPQSFAAKPLQEGAADTRSTHAKPVFNAALVYLDHQGLPQPFLAAALPELSTDTWTVQPDGRMKTTYHLKPNLAWHDGQPLTGEDFAFAWRVYATPDFGVSESPGFRSIEEVVTPDPLTVQIRWRETYQAAGQVYLELPPLPRHVLEQPYLERRAATDFISLPFWTSEYVGAGPWKLDRREPGAFFEGSGFDRFVFGPPRIDRIRVIYQPDSNTAVATLLSGEAHYSVEALLHGEEGATLEQGWAANKAGIVLWGTDIPKGQEIQLRPEFAVPIQLATDARVRQALAFAIDRVTLTDVVTAGRGLLREIFTHPHAPYYDQLLGAVPTRYGYDPRRAEQLLQEAGFTRNADSGWMTPDGGRFGLEQWYLSGATNERDSAILIDSFRRLGIDASSNEWGIQRTSQEERAKTSGLFGGNIGVLPDKYHTRNIARPENRWTGTNRFGFSSPEMDRIVDSYATSLDRTERIQRIAAMERLAMEQLPAIPTYWTAVVVAHAVTLKGVVQNLMPEAGDERLMWTWEWQA